MIQSRLCVRADTTLSSLDCIISSAMHDRTVMKSLTDNSNRRQAVRATYMRDAHVTFHTQVLTYTAGGRWARESRSRCKCPWWSIWDANTAV